MKSRLSTKNASAAIPFLLLSCFLLLFSCASYRDVSESEQKMLQQKAHQFASEMKVNTEMERQLLFDGLNEMMAFTSAKGDRHWPEKMERCESLKDYIDLIYSQLNSSPRELVLEANAYWNSHSDYVYIEDPINYETDHFLFTVYPRSPAHRDIEYLGAAMEEYLETLLDYMSLNSEQRQMFRRNSLYLPGGKITLMLPPDTKLWSGFSSTAQVSMGLSYHPETGEATFEMPIQIPYYNGLSSSAMVHELTHMIEILSKKDLMAMIQEIEDTGDIQGVFDRFVTEVMPHDTPVGEGFAQHASALFSPFQHNILPNVHSSVKASLVQRDLPQNLLSRNSVKTGSKERMVQYLYLESLTTYLIETYGKDRFLTYFMTVPLTEEQFISSYSMTYQEAEEEWRQSLLQSL